VRTTRQQAKKEFMAKHVRKSLVYWGHDKYIHTRPDELWQHIEHLLEKGKKEMLERVEKLVDSVASHFNATRVRKENGESEWAFPDRSSELRTRENYQVSLVLKAFDEGLSSLKGKRRAIK